MNLGHLEQINQRLLIRVYGHDFSYNVAARCLVDCTYEHNLGQFLAYGQKRNPHRHCWR